MQAAKWWAVYSVQEIYARKLYLGKKYTSANYEDRGHLRSFSSWFYFKDNLSALAYI